MLKYAKSAVLSSATVNSGPDAAIAGKRASFAAGVARYEFGGSYAPPDDAGFIERSPGEIAVLRAHRSPGAAQ